MSLDTSRRLERLREILPSVYDTRPKASLIGDILERVAGDLAAMDEAQRRVLHDHWLPLSLGDPAQHGVAALDRLGALLDAPRLRGPGNAEARETADAYRARLSQTARALFGCATTPRALLSLALAALGAEVCPRMDTHSPARQKQGAGDPARPDAPWVVDATEAYGMPIGTRRRCAGCRGGGGKCMRPDTPPMIQARLVENPVTPASRTVEAAYGRPFEVESRSLLTDRPVVQFTPVGAEGLTNPGLQNRATGETVLFHGQVKAGETLILFPRLDPKELRPFDHIEPDAHHRWTQQQPGCRALLSGPDGESDVSGFVHFISGSQFDDLASTYAGPAPNSAEAIESGIRFAETAQGVRTPRLRPGADSWRLLRFEEPAPRAGGPETRAEDLNAEGEGDLEFEPAQTPADTGDFGSNIAVVRLDWLVRPPATVLLSLLRSPQLDAAQHLGAMDLLLRDLDRARAAGVQVVVEVRERPAPREAAHLGENEPLVDAVLDLREALAPTDRAPAFSVGAAMTAERHEVADGAVAWSGLFDFTSFDWTSLE